MTLEAPLRWEPSVSHLDHKRNEGNDGNSISTPDDFIFNNSCRNQLSSTPVPLHYPTLSRNLVLMPTFEFDRKCQISHVWNVCLTGLFEKRSQHCKVFARQIVQQLIKVEEPRSEKIGNTDGVCRQARPNEGSPGSKLGGPYNTQLLSS